jgi:putative acetyltransferase
MNIHLRPVAEADNAALAQLIRTISDEYEVPRLGTVYSDPRTDALYQLFQAPRSVFWVAEIDGAIIGCGGLYPTPGLGEQCVELVKFYLAAAARGRGLGRQLLDRCLASALELGYQRVYLESFPQFVAAIAMYEKLGFRHLPGPLGQSGHSACPVWMLKELD